MKRRINLLSITFTKRELTEVIGDVRTKALILMGIFFVLGISEVVVYSFLNDKFTQFQNSKTTLEQYLQSNKEVDHGIKYFIFKYGLLNTYLAEDANSYFYYTKVQRILNEFAPEGKLSIFSYENTGEATISVSFANFEQATTLLKAVETPEFIDNFEYVTLEGFDASPKIDQKEFVVSLKAKIIQENESESQSN